MNHAIRPGMMTAFALACSLIAQPGQAGVSAQYGAEDQHLDGLISQCAGPLAAYAQVLSVNNPPEVVELSIRSSVNALRGAALWSASDIAERQAVNDGALRSAIQSPGGDPSSPLGIRFMQCVTGAELAARQTSAPKGP